MRRGFGQEVYKALSSKWFYIAVSIGLVLGFGSLCSTASFFIDRTLPQLSQAAVSNPMIEAKSVFNNWIGGEGLSPFSSIFSFVFPLLSTLPYAWSYQYEKSAGYQNQLLLHETRFSYLLTKYAAVFLSGGLAVLVPLIINFLCTCLIFPVVTPDVSYCHYYGIYNQSPFCELFYSQPLLFETVYLLIDFIFGGIFACLALSFSLLGVPRIISLLLPMLICLLLHVCTPAVFLLAPPPFSELEYSPLNYLLPGPKRAFGSLGVMLTEGLFFMLFSALAFYLRWRKKDAL